MSGYLKLFLAGCAAGGECLPMTARELVEIIANDENNIGGDQQLTPSLPVRIPEYFQAGTPVSYGK